MKKIEISDKAASFLERRNNSLDDTWATVLDRVIEEFKELDGMRDGAEPRPAAGGMPLLGSNTHNYARELPDVTHSKIEYAKIRGKSVDNPNWVGVLEKAIEAALGAPIPLLLSKLPANVIEGKHSNEKDYYFVKTAGISFQKLNAQNVLENLKVLAEEFSISVEIEFWWDEKDNRTDGNGTGHILLP